MGMGSSVGSALALTESGRGLARQYLEANQYSGRAPVPAEQYADIVRRQRQQDGWLTKEALAKAFRGMVLTESILSQMGPAVSAGKSLLLYGKPGDGKTFLIEQLANLDTAPI
jgi:predicted ATPase with chaperone activity